MTKIEEVVMSGSCYNNIERSIIETQGKEDECEVTGDLIGYVDGKVIRLVNAYPWPLFYPRNYHSRKRVRERDRTTRTPGKSSIVGQYHSHPFKQGEEMRFGLSTEDTAKSVTENDIVFFTSEMKNLGLNESIQIVANVRTREYRKNEEIEMRIKRYPRNPKKARVTFGIPTMNIVYTIIFSAYLLSARGTTKQLSLNYERIKVGSRRRVLQKP